MSKFLALTLLCLTASLTARAQGLNGGRAAPLLRGGASECASKASPVRAQAADIAPIHCPQRKVPDFIWGLTATNVANVPAITSALADLGTAFTRPEPGALPPIMVRVVFDPSKTGEDYLESVRDYQTAVVEISKYAYVMGTIADSYDWYPYVGVL